MKTWKQFAALLLACMMVLPAFSCTHSNSNAEGSTADASGADPSSLADDLGVTTDDDGLIVVEPTFVDDVVEESDLASDPENFIVTTLRGDDGTAYVAQTDINGTTVTDQEGAAVTEVYTGTTLATTYVTESGSTYTPAYKNFQAFWLDMSQKADFVFDGELLVLEMEISEDAVDGVYPVQFYYADVANWDAKTLSDVTMNAGYICVNCDEPEVDQPTGSGLTINPGVVSGSQGDTVKLSINIANNPGFVGFRLRLRYDSNAFKIVDQYVGEALEPYAGVSGKDDIE